MRLSNRSRHPYHKSVRRLGLAIMVAAALLLPPFVFETSLLRAEPAPSGAEAAYPLNHTFDSDVQPIGTPPANSDFGASPYTVGVPPTNYDFSAPPTNLDFPNDYDFEAGDLGPWHPSGTVTLQTASDHGQYARLDASGACIESDPFTVSSTAQKLVFDWGVLSPTGNAWLTVTVEYGTNYGTTFNYPLLSCSNCGWTTRYLDLSQFAGQSIKVRFTRHSSSTTNHGIDNVRTENVLAGFDLSGNGNLANEGGNGYASLDSGYIVSSAFTVDGAVQNGMVDIRGFTALSDQYYVYVLSGSGFGTSTQVALGTVGDAAWEHIRFNLVAYRGQQIKLKVARQYGTIGVDNVGVQWVDVPAWDVTKDARAEVGGAAGNYVSTNGNLTSAPFMVPQGAQQLSVDYKGATTTSIFYVEFLRGPDFATVTDINGGSSITSRRC